MEYQVAERYIRVPTFNGNYKRHPRSAFFLASSVLNSLPLAAASLPQDKVMGSSLSGGHGRLSSDNAC